MVNSERTNISPGGEYQVFLNFRGYDICHGFADTLYHSLDDAQICIFMDDAEIRAGDKIDDKLMQAIDNSKLYIPIFSPNYASSHWCLVELAKMMENIRKFEEDENKKAILPIFYNVEPEELKLNTPLYRDAILNLEKKKVNQEKKFRTEDVGSWRTALREVNASKGLKLKDHSGDGGLSKSVVEEVVNKLQTRQRAVTQYLIGMEDQKAAINKLLNIQSGGVQIIGIWGMSGIGKTTLAKVIFNELCPLFGKNCSFLDDVREMAKTKGLVKLQERLLSDISNPKVARKICNIDQGIKWIGGIICNKKVLIVLDDVDESNQIQNLVGVNLLYPGTTILITTTDKNVLKIKGFKYDIMPYEMKWLTYQEALQLFSRHAFVDNYSRAKYYTLSKGIVSTTGGLPLALEAIGSMLFGLNEEWIWKETLKWLMKTPNVNVLGKLRVIYDTLETDQQQIFVDIACFFIGYKGSGPISLWKDCEFRAKYAIDVLINKSMIKILDDNSFWMHNQFRYLGRAIAKQDCTRLWDIEDITCGLRSTDIKRSVRTLNLGTEVGNPITVTAEQIKQFLHLQFIRLSNVTCQGDFTGCLPKLKWISLDYSRTPEGDQGFQATNFPTENMVVMELYGHEFTVDKFMRLTRGARKLEVVTVRSDYTTKIMDPISARI